MVSWIIKPIAYFVGGIIAIVLGVLIAALAFAFVTTTPHIGYFAGSSYFLTWLAWLSGFTLVVCIVLLILFFLFRLFTSYRLKKPIRNGLIGTGLISIILFVFSMLFHMPNYADSATYKESNTYSITDQRIEVSELINEEMSEGIAINLGEPIINKRGLFCDDVRVNIYKSDDNEIRIEREVSSHGSSKSEARKFASHVICNEEINNNQILIPEAYKIKRGNRYRGQNVRFNLYIPKNKKVEVDDNMHWVVWKNEFVEKDRATQRQERIQRNKERREKNRERRNNRENNVGEKPGFPENPERPENPEMPDKPEIKEEEIDND